MSGIAGIIHFDGAPVAPGLVERMTAAMAYRGPDGIRHWIRGSVALGQCMLCTTPESLEERQPLTNEDESLVLVMDGRVDNWEELRRELLGRGVVLRERTDAELVLRAYETWGRECLAHVDGDFALAIWDARRKEAFCARDRLGNKPFVYHWDGKSLAFASDVHSLLELPWLPADLNVGMLAEFLANEWHSHDETFWRGVLRLPQANRMQVTAMGPRIDEYWQPDVWESLAYASHDEYVEHYRALLGDVVRRMSRSAGPLACEVSGGLDSSALFAMTADLHRRGRLPAPDVEGYTLAFAGSKDADELDFARAVRDHVGLPVHEIEPSRKPLSWYRERARRLRIFPSYPNGVMGLGIRQEASARGSRALLVGIGGDEWLGGTASYYAEAFAARQWSALLSSLRADCGDFGVYAGVWRLLRHGCYPLLPPRLRSVVRNVLRTGRMARDAPVEWLTDSLQEELQRRRGRYRVAARVEVRRAGQRSQLQTLASPFSMHARDLEEGLASSQAIELRRPFLHPAIIQFAFMTPEHLRVRGRMDRALHREAMAGYLPECVLTRTSKADFMETFRWHLAEMRQCPRSDPIRVGGAWIRMDRVERLQMQAGNPEYDGLPEWKLWTLFGCSALIADRAESADVGDFARQQTFLEFT